MKDKLKLIVRAFAAMYVMALVLVLTGAVPADTLLADIVTWFVPAGMVMAAAGVEGPGEINEGGAEVGDGEAEYIDEDLDTTIVKVRPSETPLDTLTRNIKNVERVKSFECGGWEMGTRDALDTVAATVTSGEDAEMSVNKKNMWLPGDTIYVNGVTGKDGGPLALYVVSKGTGDKLNVKAVNSADGLVPALTADTVLLRMSTAHAEKDAQAAPYNISPTPRRNYCQIHMTQVEETVIHGLQKKKVDLNFSTYKEQSIWDMKRGMEFTNLFGVMGVTRNDKDEPIYLSNGVWHQCPNVWGYSKAKNLDNAAYVAMTRAIFDGNNGSETRFLFAGSGFLERMAYVDAYTKQIAAANVEVVHGVKVRRIVSDFGELLIKPMSSLFLGNMADNALVLDMNYVKKYVFEPLHTTTLELDKTGQRRVNAVRLLENYALFLENLPTHCKIIATE